MKSNLSSVKINTMFKESGGFKNMLKRKMKMIHNKHLKGNNSQLTYSNIYNNSNGKIRLENSLYQKASKNESFVGKKGSNMLDDDFIIHNINKKVISPRIEQKTIDQDTSNEEHKCHFEHQKQSSKNKNGIYSNNDMLNNKINNYLYNKNLNIMNQNKAKSQRPISNSSSSSIYSSSNNIHKTNIMNGKGGYNIMKQFDKMHAISNPHIICEYQKMSKTALPTKNNSRKNSIDKKKEPLNNNYINYNHKGYPSSAALKINKYNDAFKTKNSYSKRTISSNKKNKQCDYSQGKYNNNNNNSHKDNNDKQIQEYNMNVIESNDEITNQNIEFVNALFINPITPYFVL